MDPQRLRREVVDTLTRELEISPNKWTKLMGKLSKVGMILAQFILFCMYDNLKCFNLYI